MLKEEIKKFFEDLMTASDELAGDALEVFNIQDIDDLKKDGELVPSPKSTLNSVTSEKSRKSKAPIGPINAMKLFFYRTIKKALVEIKENVDKKIEENMKDIIDNSEMTTADSNKKREETINLKVKSNKLQDSIGKAEERVEQVESEIKEKLETKEAEKIEKETKKDIANMLKTMKNIEDNQSEVQPISIEPITEEQILSDNEQNLAYMVNAIKSNEEKEKTMQAIAAEPAEEKTDEDVFIETMNAIDEVYKEAGIVALSDVQQRYNSENQKASTKAKDIMAKYMIDQINEKIVMQQEYDKKLATQKAESEAKYTALEQSTQRIIEEKDAKINELEIKVSNYENITEQRNKQIEDQKTSIEEKDRQISELTEKASANEKEIAARDTEIERLRQYEKRFKAISEAMAPIANQQQVEPTIEQGGKTK